LNLEANPEASIQVGRTRSRVRARLADPNERARLWPELVRQNPPYGRYAGKTDREIPVVILRRES
jgi:deazaflavin-dependent oxidoreductase (nitroreductase family)